MSGHVVRAIAGAALATALAVPAAGQAPPPPGAVAPIKVKPPETAHAVVKGREVPRDVAADARLGTDALLQGRAEEAIEHFDRAQVRAPLVPEIAYDRGVAALVAGDGEGAEKALALSEELAKAPPAREGAAPPPPQLAEDTRYNLGHAALQRDELPAAIQRWAQVLAKDPSAADARRNLELALRLMEVQQQQQQQDQQDQEQDQQDQDQEQPQDPQQGDEPKPPEGQEQQPQQPKPEPKEAQGPISKEKAEQLLGQLAAEEKSAMEKDAKEKARAVQGATGKPW